MYAGTDVLGGCKYIRVLEVSSIVIMFQVCLVVSTICNLLPSALVVVVQRVQPFRFKANRLAICLDQLANRNSKRLRWSSTRCHLGDVSGTCRVVDFWSIGRVELGSYGELGVGDLRTCGLADYALSFVCAQASCICAKGKRGSTTKTIGDRRCLLRSK